MSRHMLGCMRLSIVGARVCVTCAVMLLLFFTPTRSGADGGDRGGRQQPCTRTCIYAYVHVNIYARRGADGGDRGGRQQPQCGQPGGRARGNASLGR